MRDQSNRPQSSLTIGGIVEATVTSNFAVCAKHGVTLSRLTYFIYFISGLLAVATSAPKLW
jgi:hypothetical protein